MSIFIFDHEEESTGKINIDDLYEKKQRCELKQISIFNKILARIHKHITHNSRAKKNETHVFFSVPPYILGQPVYDKGECIGYLVSQLENNGFHVRYIHPNTLFISWHNWVPYYVRQEVKKKMGIILDEKGNILDRKTKEDMDSSNPNNIIFDMNSNNSSGNNANTQKEQREYNSVKDYKPTGNLVYSPEIMERLQKKVSFNI